MSHNKRSLLIADASLEILKEISDHPKAREFDIEVARNGLECLDRIERFKPDLLLIDFMLPKIHGIEILNRIGGKNKSIGLFMTAFQTMIQNYRAALENGADDFLKKPLDVTLFFQKVEDYFQGQLQVSPFPDPKIQGDTLFYEPIFPLGEAYIRFFGTRGSNPVSGPKYVRYGGNTSSLEVRYKSDRLIIDAGTGLRPLGEELSPGEPVHLFIGHTHWDHITGFPFFSPIYEPGRKVNIYAPVGFERSPKAIFTEMLAHAFFPVCLEDIRADLEFIELRDGARIQIGELTIETHYTYHPGDTLGFKIKSPHKTIGYVTDNEALMGYHGHPKEIGKNHPLLLPHESLIAFLRECDLIIHEAQYFPKEYRSKVGWGHSSISNAAALIAATHCRDWIVTHHDPNHSDRDLQIKSQLLRALLEECHFDIQVRMAFDDLIVPL